MRTNEWHYSCDEGCNNLGCKYDRGDCNQLCLCDPYMLGNDICNKECDTPECEYDLGDCLLENSYQDCGYVGSECLNEWINDGFCDTKCKQFNNSDFCNNGDEFDCLTVVTYCNNHYYCLTKVIFTYNLR